MRKIERFTATREGVGQAVDYTREFLEANKIHGKEFTRASLTAEEAIAALVEHAEEGSMIRVFLRSYHGNVMVDISSEGSEFDLTKSMDQLPDTDEDETGASTQEALRGILLNAFTNGLKYQHKSGVNRIRMKAVKSRHSFLLWTLGALLLAIVAGLLLEGFTSKSFQTGLDSNVLTPVKTMYLNALKMCVAPVVFFSIITCVMQFSDLRELGRIGGKVCSMYLLTTVIAVGVGLGMYFLLQPGDTGLAAGQIADATSITSQKMDVSILGTITGIIPSNFVQPFVDSNMLQLIFLAIIAGVAVGMIGKHSRILCDILAACNELFLKITTIIISFMPVAVLCSICSMMLNLGAQKLLSLLGMLGTFILGLVCMMTIYCLLLGVIGRLNPVPFLKKYTGTMLQVFSMASSNASIPLNMEVCEKKLGISPRVYSLSIPLGATVNMDGSCIYMAVFSLALAKAYGVEITGAAILSLVLSIIVLSVGAPGIPGAGLICLSVVLVQIGVPVEAIGIVMGIDAFVGMFRAMSNSLGDVIVTTIVAKSEGLMDTEVYRR